MYEETLQARARGGSPRRDRPRRDRPSRWTIASLATPTLSREENAEGRTRETSIHRRQWRKNHGAKLKGRMARPRLHLRTAKWTPLPMIWLLCPVFIEKLFHNNCRNRSEGSHEPEPRRASARFFSVLNSFKFVVEKEEGPTRRAQAPSSSAARHRSPRVAQLRQA